jgi:hypothetical protein
MPSHRAALLLAPLLFACTGLIEEDVPEGLTPAQEAARKAWVVGAQPVLQERCSECHGGSMPAVGWLEGAPDLFAQKEDLLTYQTAAMLSLIDFNAPQASPLIKKGAHDGPALSVGQASGIVEWIQKEREATPETNGFPVMTEPLVMQPCTAGAPGSATCPYNEILLDAAGAAGAKLQFTAGNLSGQLYLSSIQIIPGPGGAYVEHPIFVSVPTAPAEPILDKLDRYASTKLNLAAGAMTGKLGNGTGSFPEFNPNDPIALYAKVVGPMK